MFRPLTRDQQQTILGLVALALITAGLWIERPSAALVVLGSILLAGLIYARTR